MVVLVLPGFSCRMQPPQVDVPKAARGALNVEYSRNSGTIPKYEVFEITFRHSTGRLPAETDYANPFFDVTIDVVFTSPSKKEMHVGGFCYGSSSGPDIRIENRQRQQVSYHFDKCRDKRHAAKEALPVSKGAHRIPDLSACIRRISSDLSSMMEAHIFQLDCRIAGATIPVPDRCWISARWKGRFVQT